MNGADVACGRVGPVGGTLLEGCLIGDPAERNLVRHIVGVAGHDLLVAVDKQLIHLETGLNLCHFYRRILLIIAPAEILKRLCSAQFHLFALIGLVGDP